MLRLITPFLLFGLLFIGISSCADTNKAEQYADNFFKLLAKQNYDAAAAMMDLTLPGAANFPTDLKNYCTVSSQKGKFKSAKKKMGFNTSIKNGITTVELPYELTFENMKVDVSVTLIDRGEGFRVYGVN